MKSDLSIGVLGSAVIMRPRGHQKIDVPAPFATIDWTLAAGAAPGALALTVLALPADGGSAVAAIEARVDGGGAFALDGAGVGARALAVAPGASASVELRAVNAAGAGAWSAAKAAIAPAALPDAFAAADWTLANSPSDGGDRLALSVLRLPDDGGAEISAISWRVSSDDGATWGAAQALTGVEPGARIVTVLAETVTAIAIRAENTAGFGAWSEPKAAAPTALVADASAGAPAVATANLWSVEDQGSGGQARIRVWTAPADGGSAITGYEARIGAGAWTALPGGVQPVYVMGGFTDGVATTVMLRAVNAEGPGPDSDVKSVTTTTAAVVTAASLTYYAGTTSEITITFNAAYPVRQYADGQWAVQGPVTITGATPASSLTGVDLSGGGTGKAIHGLQLNPDNGDQGFDNRNGTASQKVYSALKNVDPGVTATPLTVQPGNFVVKGRSRLSGVPTSGRELMQNYAILHVVAALPAPNSLRPGIMEPGVAATWKASDLAIGKLANFAPATGQPGYAGVQANLDAGPRVKWHTDGNGGRSLSSYAESRGKSGYAAYISHDWTEACLIANTGALTPEQKRALMIPVVQMGIDAASRVATDAWTQKGALYVGHKLPHVYAAALLDSAALATTADGAAFNYAEDEGVFTATAFDTTRTLAQDAVETGRPTRINHAPEMIGWPDWGEQAVDQSNRNNAAIGALYREIWDGPCQRSALAAQALSGGRAIWGRDIFFDYADRAMRWISTGHRAGHVPEWVRAFYAAHRDATGFARWTPVTPEQSDPPRFVAASGNIAIIRAPSTVTPFLAGQALVGFRVRHSADGVNWTLLPSVLTALDFPLNLDLGAPAAGRIVQARIVTNVGEGPWSSNLPLNRGGRDRGVATEVFSAVMPPELELEASGLEGWWRADVATHITLDGSNKVASWDGLWFDTVAKTDQAGRPAAQANTTLRPDYDAAKGQIVGTGGPLLTRLLDTAITSQWSMLLVGEVAFGTGGVANRITLWGDANNYAVVQTERQAGEPNDGVTNGNLQARLNNTTTRKLTTENPIFAGEQLKIMGVRNDAGGKFFRVRAVGDNDDDADSVSQALSGGATMGTLVIGGRDPALDGSTFRVRHALVWRRDIGITALKDIATSLP